MTKAEVTWTDFSASAGGEHLYAKIRCEDNYKELTRTLTESQVAYLNEKDRCATYKIGDTTQRFDNEEQIAKAARKVWSANKAIFPKTDLLLMGNGGVMKALEGPEDVVKRINEIYELYEALWVYTPNYAVPKCSDPDMEGKLMDEYWELVN